MKKLANVLPLMAAAAIKKARFFDHVLAIWNAKFPENLTQHCQPSRLTGSTLTMITSSPVWSHQLFSHQSHIKDTLHTAGITITKIKFMQAGDDEIRQLRSRFTAPAPKPPRLAKARRTAVTTAPTLAPTPEQLIETMRARQEEMDAQYKKKGWMACPECGQWVKKNERARCPRCADESDLRQLRLARTLLHEAPWARYQESGIAAEVSDTLFQQAKLHYRDALRAQLLEMEDPLYRGDPKQKQTVLTHYVCLRTGVKPQELTPAIIEKVAKSLEASGKRKREL